MIIIFSALYDEFAIKFELQYFRTVFCLPIYIICQDDITECPPECFPISSFEAGHVQTVSQIVEFDFWLTPFSTIDRKLPLPRPYLTCIDPHASKCLYIVWDKRCLLSECVIYVLLPQSLQTLVKARMPPRSPRISLATNRSRPLQLLSWTFLNQTGSFIGNAVVIIRLYTNQSNNLRLMFHIFFRRMYQLAFFGLSYWTYSFMWETPWSPLDVTVLRSDTFICN